MSAEDNRQAQRERLLDAVLAHAPFEGWTARALEAAARDTGIDPALVSELFPGGPGEAVELSSTRADRRMVEDLEAAGAALKTTERVALAIRLRLDRNVAHRAAIRQALSFLALPVHAPLATRLLYRTVDAIWYAAGDRSTDFNFYTKRALLAGVYSATLLYWLADRSDGQTESWAFLDRRLADVLKAGKLARRAGDIAGRLPNPFRILAGLRQRRRS